MQHPRTVRPVGLDLDALKQLDIVVTTRMRLKKGETLYRTGDVFTALYAIRLGSCKTTVLASDGRVIPFRTLEQSLARYQQRGDAEFLLLTADSGLMEI